MVEGGSRSHEFQVITVTGRESEMAKYGKQICNEQNDATRERERESGGKTNKQTNTQCGYLRPRVGDES